jgi:hypothetical protein
MLHDIQRLFKKSILEETDDLTSVVHNPAEGYSASDRLAIYRNTVFVSLKELLFDRFEATKEMVGEEFFLTVCHQFIKDHPPSVGCLMYYGGAFPTFLATQKSLSEHAYVPDVACIEWLLQESYHAVDEDVLSAKSFAEIKGEALENFAPEFCKNVHLFASKFPAVTLYNIALTEPCGGQVQNINLTTGEYALIYRDTEILDAHVITLEKDIYMLFKALENGNSFGEYCQKNEINQGVLAKSIEIALSLGLWKKDQH